MNKELFNKYGELLRQAIVLMPLECPGAEEDYPPADSIEAHRLVEEAKSLILPLADGGDVEAMSLLGNLYHTLADKAGDEYSLSMLSDIEIQYNDYMGRR